jgi:hypothetical protein
MPLRWERDDARRLVTVTFTGSYTAEDIFSVIDRQAAEGLWEYALLYDLRAAADLVQMDPAELRQRILTAGGGRPRGGSAVIVGAHPDWVRTILNFKPATTGIQEFETLITPAQVDSWIERHTRRVPTP